jgi:hypothetical protein
MNVPKTIDAPKPATKSCAISSCEKPYSLYNAYMYGPCSQSPAIIKK